MIKAGIVSRAHQTRAHSQHHSGSGRIVNLSSGLGQLRYISNHYKSILAPGPDRSNFTELSIKEFQDKITFKENDSQMKRDDHTTYKLSKVSLDKERSWLL